MSDNLWLDERAVDEAAEHVRNGEQPPISRIATLINDWRQLRAENDRLRARCVELGTLLRNAVNHLAELEAAGRELVEAICHDHEWGYMASKTQEEVQRFDALLASPELKNQPDKWQALALSREQRIAALEAAGRSLMQYSLRSEDINFLAAWDRLRALLAAGRELREAQRAREGAGTSESATVAFWPRVVRQRGAEARFDALEAAGRKLLETICTDDGLAKLTVFERVAVERLASLIKPAWMLSSPEHHIPDAGKMLDCLERAHWFLAHIAKLGQLDYEEMRTALLTEIDTLLADVSTPSTDAPERVDETQEREQSPGIPEDATRAGIPGSCGSLTIDELTRMTCQLDSEPRSACCGAPVKLGIYRCKPPLYTQLCEKCGLPCELSAPAPQERRSSCCGAPVDTYTSTDGEGRIEDWPLLRCLQCKRWCELATPASPSEK